MQETYAGSLSLFIFHACEADILKMFRVEVMFQVGQAVVGKLDVTYFGKALVYTLALDMKGTTDVSVVQETKNQ